MKSCKAFTLIEVLLVTAIIAILAAILFPVINSARASSDKNDSVKHLALIVKAAFVYGADCDDKAMPVTYWGDSHAPITVNGRGMTPWTTIISPYMFSADYLLDPKAPPFTSFGANYSTNLAKQLQPQFGYNSTTFSPMIFATGGFVPTPIHWSETAHPEATIAFAAKNARAEVRGIASPAGFYSNGAINVQFYVQQPFCDMNGNAACAYWWGVTSSSQWLGSRETAGAFTGSVSMRGSSRLMSIAWADGHFSAEPWQSVAAGTDVHQTAPGIWANGNNGIHITNPAQYVWDAQ